RPPPRACRPPPLASNIANRSVPYCALLVSLLVPAGFDRARGSAQRTAQHFLTVFQVQILPALRHLTLELFVVQQLHLAKLVHHVVNRSMAEARPVSRVGHVPIGRCVVESTRDAEN